MTASDVARPVVAETTVPVSPKRAFTLYVDRPHRLHPREGLSGAPEAIVYEPFSGGRWYERDTDGGEHDWGQVLEWAPPHRLVLAWMVGVIDGRWAHDPNPAHASRVEITFEPAGPDTTRVRVVHSGFQAHGDGASSIRSGVSGGWNEDLVDLGSACHTARL